MEKRAAQVRMKGNIAETQSGHHREGPVNTGDPGIVLPLKGHQEMEDDAVDGHQKGQNEKEFEKQAEIAFGAFAVRKIAQYGRVILHGFSPRDGPLTVHRCVQKL